MMFLPLGVTKHMARRLNEEHLQSSTGTLIGIPRGGLVTAMLIALMGPTKYEVASSEDLRMGLPDPWWLVDDIIVTGETARKQLAPLPSRFAGILTLVGKGRFEIDQVSSIEGVTVHSEAYAPEGEWVTFPWEVNELSGPEDAVKRLLEYAGDDPTRAGLKDTPARVLRFLDEVREDRSFETTAFESKGYDDLIVVRNIQFASLCEHHMLPFFGAVAIGYIPNDKILGLSKLARIVYQESGGLTLQEAFTRRIADHASELAGTKDVAVVVNAVHSCMVVRGPRALGSDTLTSAMLGKFRDEPELRAEFFSIVGSLSR